MLNDFMPSSFAQLNLLDDVKLRERNKPLTQVIYHFNQTGMGNIWFVRRGIEQA